MIFFYNFDDFMDPDLPCKNEGDWTKIEENIQILRFGLFNKIKYAQFLCFTIYNERLIVRG